MQSPDHPDLRFVQARYFQAGRGGRQPIWIVVHDMEAGESSDRAENTAEYFRTMPDGRSVSSHYCVDSDSVIQCVRLKDTAYTVGNIGNQLGINWELAGFARQTRAEWLDVFSQAMFRQMAPYVRADAQRYGIPLLRRTVAELRALVPGITSHNDLRLAFGGTTHTDPGAAFPWDVFLATIKEDDMPLTAADRDLIWGKKYRDYVPLPSGTRPERTVGELVALAREDAFHARAEAVAIKAVLAGLGNPDVAAILAGVDERLAALRAGVREDVDDELDEAFSAGADKD